MCRGMSSTSFMKCVPCLFRGMRGIVCPLFHVTYSFLVQRYACPLFHVILPLFRGMRGIVQGFIQGGWETGIPPPKSWRILGDLGKINSGEECPQSRTLLIYKEFPPPKPKIL